MKLATLKNGTRDALEIAPAAASVEWTGYVDSWKGAR